MEASENCSVKVALHIRPLIGDERSQGCRECVSVTPGKPQIQIGTHSFTFDHVYGSGGAPSSAMFEECISPLIEGLFQGYNATVLAYGQTGSGKTYTMGTGSGDGCQTGLIPKVMNALFRKIDNLKHQTEFQLQVSFIEILKEEVRDLLDSVSLSKLDASNGYAVKMNTQGRHLLQIRETSNGAITLAGLTEVVVSSSQEMAACLAQGSLSRATASTNMNNQSSRSHAIFTITLEQLRKIRTTFPGNDTPDKDMGEEYFCAKFHLVDLAGSERAKRTGSDGHRLKEGIHINKGLLALGNVISALGDEKKRKEGMHVPYRDSKLTRLLQDSLGGNSKTVMIACISPADINAEESLNTLKYANRARNIQNKPIVNRDVISNEMQKMKEQLKLLQAELCTRGGGAQFDEVPVLKERIAWLEARNEELCRELHRYRSRCAVQSCETNVQEGNACFTKSDGLKRGYSGNDSSVYPMGEISSGENSGEIDEVTKEWEHQCLQNSLDMELNDLNKRLEQKESEMKNFGGVDTVALKQHFGKKIMELEKEKRTVQEQSQQERDRLLAEVESLASSNSDGQGQKLKDVHAQKLKTLETQISDLKKKQENQVQLLREKQKSDEAAKRLQAEIQYIKSQKVQLQHRIKQEAEKFRQWKASREKELLQLRKEGRRNEFERYKLEALNQRQKIILQRKAEEATNATKRLKQLLEARKSVIRDNSANSNGHSPGNSNGHTSASQVKNVKLEALKDALQKFQYELSIQGNERSLQRWLDHELDVMVHVHEVRHEYEKQQQLRAALDKELAMFKQANQLSSEGHGTQLVKSGLSRVLSMSLDARMARIASLENMLSMSSNALMVMATQLSEAEERDRSLSGRGRWNQVRSMGDAKNLLQYIFNSAAETRCQLWEKKMEIKDMEDQLNELLNLLRKSEAQRKELVKEQKLTEPAVAVALSTPAAGNPRTSLKHFVDDMSGPLSPISLPAPKQLKFTPGIVSSSGQDSATFLNQTQKLVPVGQLSMRKLATMGHAGKLWKWKRSHHQWLLQFKWKWQKPWKLSEWIKHSDETLIRSRPRPQAQIDMT